MIEVKNLTKRYGSHLAVNNITFSVPKGQILGFLGPNGAGKTTVMNILTGYLSATDGEAIINGANILDEPEKAKKNIGYLPENPPVYGDMLVTEYLNFVCDIKGVNSSEKQGMIKEITQLVKISDIKNRLIRNLSKGYKQRVGLAQALVGYPNVIILDEPTVGLDPKQTLEMRDVIRKFSKDHTIILSSHILTEVAAICDRVLIINKGVIVASDTPERLSQSMTENRRLVVRVKGDRTSVANAFENSSMMKIERITQKEQGAFDLVISGEPGADIREAVFMNCSAKQLPILMMKPLDLSLEEIFLQITSDTFVDTPALENAGSDGQNNEQGLEG